jgi:hypothetical protein
VKDVYYVVFDRNGIVKFTRTPGFRLDQGQYAQLVELVVDDALFSPIKVPKVTLNVNALGVARVVDAEVEGDATEEAECPK